MHVSQRSGTGYPLEYVVSSIMSTDVAFEGMLLDEGSRSMIDQSKIGVTGSPISRALVFENEYTLAGKGSMLPNTQRPRSGSAEIPKTRMLPYGLVPNVGSKSGPEGLCIVPTSSPSILLA